MYTYDTRSSSHNKEMLKTNEQLYNFNEKAVRRSPERNKKLGSIFTYKIMKR